MLLYNPSCSFNKERLGGLGVLKIVDVSLPVFLSLVHGTKELTKKILINTLVYSEVLCKAIAVDAWQIACFSTVLFANPFSQRQWDAPNVGTLLDDTTFHLMICLRLGAPCVFPHFCFCAFLVAEALVVYLDMLILTILSFMLVTTGISAVREPNCLVRDRMLCRYCLGRWPLVWATSSRHLI